MKKVMKQAAKYESKKSLDGAMKFLKGNAKDTKKTMKKK
jgi:ferritin